MSLCIYYEPSWVWAGLPLSGLLKNGKATSLAVLRGLTTYLRYLSRGFAVFDPTDSMSA
ncbi:hypothetical protein PROFUN_00598 [Planoprotostelium fungivorum]|uniref:Uncharacterized protein n=1 Tax=Planoprotostelium fungivorum TaxID=1890364 RepID=A0A2P6NTT3_9EUKA|nr:hypothetical protein PROFUN_00598 [Planoprotostelium fungivorum]